MASQHATLSLTVGDAEYPFVTHCKRADRWHQRLVGLLGRASLAEDHALLIAPCSSVHTFAMRFAIDVVFLDADNKVTAVEHRLAPWRVARARASTVLELAAGVARRHEIDVGDSIHVRVNDAPPNFGETLA